MCSAPTASADATSLPARHARAYVRILEALCGGHDLPAVAERVLGEIAQAVGCQAAGLRIPGRRGDYPFLASVGFGRDAARSGRGPADGADGSRVLDGACGIVMRGQTDPARPHFTAGGSFWTNALGLLLSGEAGRDLGGSSPGAGVPRGHESVAIVPVRTGDGILGAIQVGAARRGLFSSEDVEFLERIGRRLGGAVAAWRHGEELRSLAAVSDERRRGAEAVMAIGQMISTISHDIKNPLAGMMLAAQRLKKGLDSLPGQEKLAYIADRLCASIETLSATASRVSGRVKEPALEMSPADVNDILDSAATLAARRAREQGVRIVVDLAPGLPRVRADSHFLRRAFLNLIENGLDAMPTGGELVVSTRALDRGRVEVLVADTGSGVGPDVVEALFNPFVSTKPGGAGLGLPLVRRIAELHGGAASLRGRPAGGTEAVIVIPGADPGVQG